MFPKSFPGVKNSRGPFVVDIDPDRVRKRVADSFNQELTQQYPGVMQTRARFHGRAVRDALLARGGPTPSGFARYAYRPFDTRWLYWEADTKRLDEKRADYRPHMFVGKPSLAF